MLFDLIGIIGITGFILGIFGSIYMLITKKAGAKQITILAFILLIFGIIGAINSPGTKQIDKSNKTTDTSENIDNANDSSETENPKNSSDTVLAFNEFLTSQNDLYTMIDEFYSHDNQSELWDSSNMKGMKFKVTGTVIEVMGERLAVVPSHKYNGEDWTSAQKNNDLLPYVVFIKEATTNTSQGDVVTAFVELTSRGSKSDSFSAQWDSNFISQ